MKELSSGKSKPRAIDDEKVQPALKAARALDQSVHLGEAWAWLNERGEGAKQDKKRRVQ